MTHAIDSNAQRSKAGYNLFLLFVAGLGGLLYGVDVGIIAGALPYLEAALKLNPGQLSFLVAAVLLGSVISTLFAGALADLIGRKKLMALSGLLFIISVPMIAVASGYWPIVYGRLLQGISAGLIGVVVPLYLAECLTAPNRGKGTGIFQFLLTLGIVAAAVIALYFSHLVDEVSKSGDADKLLAVKDFAWRSIFWVTLPPGILFFIGSLLVSESPRWLFRRGRTAAAHTALLRSRTAEQTETELKEMQETATRETAQVSKVQIAVKESLLRRKYVIPFLLACVILACTQATGVNSIIGYNATILIQAGLSDEQAHLGYTILTVVNFVVTIGGIALVDRKGRKFLLSLGTAGIILSLVCAGFLFRGTEKLRVDVKEAVQAMVNTDQTLNLSYNVETANKLLDSAGEAGKDLGDRTSLALIYSYGDFHSATPIARSDDPTVKQVVIKLDDCVPASRVAAFLSNPFADYKAARAAPLVIDNALITPVPGEQEGWVVAGAVVHLHGFLRRRSGRLRVAGAFGTDAHAHSLQRHEHRAVDQPSSVHSHCGDLFTHGRALWIFDSFLCFRRLHGDLFCDRRFLPAGDKG